MNHQKINSKPSHYSGITYCGKSFATHFHNSYELICVLKGDVQVTINAYSTSLHENYFLLIPPCMIHSISESENAVFFIAILTADYIPDFFERHKKNEIYMFTVESDSFSYLNDHFFQKRRPDGYLLKACLYIILAYAEKGEKLIPTRSTDYDFIFAVNLYIAEHFFEPIKRTQLAQITGYEEHYFSNLFKCQLHSIKL